MKFDFETVVDRSTTGSLKWRNAINTLKRPLEIPPLSTADMEFVCCPSIEKTMMEALRNNGVMGYTSCPNGFIESVVNWLKVEHEYDAKPEWILQTHGVVHAIYTAINCLTNEGDEIIIQTPVYHQFKMAINNTKRTCIENPLVYQDGKYTMDFDDLAKKAKTAKMLILCSPHNPIGRVWTKEELEKLHEICDENNLFVIADEIHFDFIAQGHKHICYGNLENSKMMLCTSPSKTFNLAGLNISNIIIPDQEIREKYQNYLRVSGNGFQTYFGYYATMGAYSDEGREWKNELNEVIQENYLLIKNFFETNYPEMHVVDLQATYLVWIDMRCLGLTGAQLKQQLIEKGELFIDEGSSFGDNGEGFIRINIACPKSVLLKVLEHFKRALG